MKGRWTDDVRTILPLPLKLGCQSVVRTTVNKRQFDSHCVTARTTGAHTNTTNLTAGNTKPPSPRANETFVKPEIDIKKTKKEVTCAQSLRYKGACPNTEQAGCPPGKFGFKRSWKVFSHHAMTKTTEEYCVKCPEGKFQSSTGYVECFGCEKGEYANMDGTQCYAAVGDNTVCTAGKFTHISTYRMGTGSVMEPTHFEHRVFCYPCPDGKFSAADMGACWSCRDGEQSNNGNTGCMNKFHGDGPTPPPSPHVSGAPTAAPTAPKRVDGYLACMPGKFRWVSTHSSASFCLLCPAGQFSKGGARSCSGGSKNPTPAPANPTPVSTTGVYGDWMKQVKTALIKAKNANQTISKQQHAIAAFERSYKKCEPGKFVHHILNNPVRDHTCVTCPAGKFQASPGYLECYQCPPGKYATDDGARLCSTCPHGMTADKTNRRCTFCNMGWYSNRNSGGQCVQCEPGTFTRADIQTHCDKCVSGKYSLGGASLCQQCPSGTYNVGVGNVMCKNCMAGQVEDMSNTNCYRCKRGTKPDASRSKCISEVVPATPSPLKVPSLPQPTKENKCPVGKYFDQMNPSLMYCLPCPPGKYQSRPRVELCFTCPPGKYQDWFLQSSCKDCSRIAGQESYKTCSNTSDAFWAYKKEMGHELIAMGFQRSEARKAVPNIEGTDKAIHWISTVLWHQAKYETTPIPTPRHLGPTKTALPSALRRPRARDQATQNHSMPSNISNITSHDDSKFQTAASVLAGKQSANATSAFAGGIIRRGDDFQGCRRLIFRADSPPKGTLHLIKPSLGMYVFDGYLYHDQPIYKRESANSDNPPTYLYYLRPDFWAVGNAAGSTTFHLGVNSYTLGAERTDKTTHIDEWWFFSYGKKTFLPQIKVSCVPLQQKKQPITIARPMQVGEPLPPGRPCPAGKYTAPVAGNTYCRTCSEGQFSEVGALNCTMCGVSTTSNSNRTGCMYRDADCRPAAKPHGQNCIAGKYTKFSEAGAWICIGCKPGQFQSSGGYADCNSCSLGQFTDRCGQPECVKCPFGESSPDRTSCQTFAPTPAPFISDQNNFTGNIAATLRVHSLTRAVSRVQETSVPWSQLHQLGLDVHGTVQACAHEF